jgi:hypothetical protein
VRPDRAPDQAVVREMVEPAGTAVALSRGEHEREVARAGRFAEALPECDDELLGNGDADESTDREGVAVEYQLGGRLGRDDLRAPPSRHGSTLSTASYWILESCWAHSRSRSSNFGTLPVEVFGSSSKKATALGAL